MYMLLEYMDLGDLRMYLQNQGPNIDTEQRLWFCSEIAAGMAYLASIPVVHRDVAARNVLLKSNPNPNGMRCCIFTLCGLVPFSPTFLLRAAINLVGPSDLNGSVHQRSAQSLTRLVFSLSFLCVFGTCRIRAGQDFRYGSCTVDDAGVQLCEAKRGWCAACSLDGARDTAAARRVHGG